jgi:hypothetical protein
MSYRFVLDTLKDFESEIPIEKKQEHADFEKHIEKLLSSLEGFSDEEARKEVTFWKNPRFRFSSGETLFESFLEDTYFRDLMKQIPKMVQRTLQLTQIVTSRINSQATAVYLREATRTYLNGFCQASIALSRAAVEEALREKAKGMNLGIESYDLKLLIQAANRSGILDDAHLSLARHVQRSGNLVLHGKPGSDRDAWDVLCAARGVLLHLFSN